MVKHTTITRQTDSKGRVTLGKAFANKIVIIDQHGDELRVRLGRVVPESEAWLYENQEALESVRRGLDQARKRQFSEGPNLADAAELAEQIPDD